MLYESEEYVNFLVYILYGKYSIYAGDLGLKAGDNI